MLELIDVVIIGAGPAGLTAFLYASLYGLKTVCVGDEIGGKVNLAPEIVDYPGIENITGKEFLVHLNAQLVNCKAEVVIDEVLDIQSTPSSDRGVYYNLQTKSGKSFHTRIVIFATGNGRKQKINRGAQLSQQLGVQLINGLLTTDNKGHTNKSGIFAAGDCTQYPSSLEQLVTAVSSGVVTVAGVFENLRGSRPPILWGEAKIRRF